MPRRRERSRPTRETVQEALLVSAREVFVADGYHGATLEQISARAGFSKGAVYSNFDSKEDLFLALLVRENAERSDTLAGLVAASIEPDLAAVAAGLLMLAAQRRPILALAEFRSHADRNPELAARLAAVRDGTIDTAVDLLETFADAWRLAFVVPPRETALVLLALVNGLALEQVGNADPRVRVETVLTVLQGLVRPSP